MLKRLFCSETNILVLIGFNALVLTLLYFPAFDRNPWLEGIDKIITILFVIEAAVKIGAWGVKGYFGNAWNRFDFLLVTLSLPSTLAMWLPLPDTSFWLMLRLFRLARLVRLFRFVPHIEKLLAGLGRAVKSSFLVMAVLAFFNFLLAMINCHFFRHVCPDMFGDPFQAMYTMFQVFTIEGWNEIPLEIKNCVEKQNLSNRLFSGEMIVALTRIYFATTMLLGGIFGLSLANAVFVDEMTIDNTEDLETKVDQLSRQLEEIRDLLMVRDPQ
jgi:voltage-gated sodium channel